MRHFKVNEILTAADRERFHALLDDPRQTLNTLHTWMIGQGYNVCRGAVGNYRRAVRQNMLAGLNRTMAGCSDGACRKRIMYILPKLHGRDLAHLAVLAESMGLSPDKGTIHRPQGGEPERHGRRSACLPGRSRRV